MKKIELTYVVNDDGTRVILRRGSVVPLYTFNTRVLNTFEEANMYVNAVLGASIRACELEEDE